ncbi:MAG: CotH kinase family protein [Verrucomicrobiales bacterium]
MATSPNQNSTIRPLGIIAAVLAGWFFAGFPARADLIAYFDFDNQANPHADVSGNGNHITGNAGTNPVWGATTGFDNSGAYDFSGDRLIVPVDINPVAMPRMTWGAWVRTDTLSSGLYKVLGHDNGNWDRTLGLDHRNPNGSFRYTSFVGDDPVNASGPVEGTPAPLSTAAWTFIAASYDQVEKQATMYVDLDASTTADALVAVTEPAGFGTGWNTFAIGAIRPDINAEPWDGAIDNVFLYNEVLSSAAVTALRNAGGVRQLPKISSFSAVPGHITSGQSTTLSWNTSRADTVSITPGAPAISGATGSVSVSPAATTTFTLTATSGVGSVTAQVFVAVNETVLPPRLTEFMAANGGSLPDGDGNYSDWIEVWNPNPFAIGLGGYALRDSTTTWVFPNVQLPALARLIVFASGQLTPNYTDAGGFLHTTFQLSSNGETLQMVAPDGTTVLSEFLNVPEQHTDASWGLEPNTNTAGYFKPATPGAANGTALAGFVKDTKFDIDRGFFDAPVTVTITSVTPDASISYTTNGTEPTPANGVIVPPAAAGQTPAAAVLINKTTVLRAIAFRSGWVSTGVDTQSYIFPGTSIDQPANPPGFPATWGVFTGTNGSTVGVPVPADYEMKPAIVNANRPAMIAALRALPTMSIVADPADLFSNNGILPNPFGDVNGVGVFTQSPFVPDRKCSMEWIQPDGAREIQVNCAVRLIGGWSRHYEATPKKSLRLTFEKAFGPGKLNFPLFGEGEISEFDRINLRATFSDAWVDNAHPAQYLRDPFMRETYLAMGQPASRGTFVHLYLNGLYWGIYNPTERPDDDYASSHYGGRDEDYDSLKHQSLTGPGGAPTDSYEMISGTSARWQQALTASGLDMRNAANYNNLRQYVDMTCMADYVIVNSFLSNLDWPGKNWYAFGRRDGADGGFKFVPWDSEYSLLDLSANRLGVSATVTPTRFYDRAKLNPEFRLLFADRVHKHCYNGGPLTSATMIARYTAMAAVLEPVIDAEAARWGDNRNTRQGVRDFRKSHWITARNTILNSYLPNRPAIALAQYRAAGLYPATAAPEFNQNGGVIEPPLITFINSPQGTVYYTTDGSDPRLAGGAVNPTATGLAGGSVTETYFALEATGWRYFITATGLGDSEIVAGHAGYGVTNWKHPDFDQAAWSTGQAMLGYGGITNRTMRTAVGFGGDPANRYPTTYFRKAFTVADASLVSKLLIDVIRDDGAIIYVNGREAGRTNIPAGNRTYESYATGGASPEDAVIRIEYVPPPGVLRNGVNILAAELHQETAGSSDTGIDVALQAQITNSGIALAQSGTVKARTRSAGGEWSALTEAFFTVAAEPATAANLVISKIHYHPADPSPEEVSAGFGDDRMFEFIELMNHGPRTVSLARLQFVDGISFAFAPNVVAELAPGQRGVVVNNTAAFTARYGAGVKVFGQFADGNLNNDGESIALLNAAGADLWRFTYNDGGAWPDSPDGLGPALALISPATPPDNSGMSLPENWRPSSAIGGQPGADDRTSFASWLAAQPDSNPLADPDGDGINQLLAFSTGARTGAAAHRFLPSVVLASFTLGAGTDNFPVISVRELIGASGIASRIESSGNLQSWSPAGIALVSVTDHGDGTMTRAYRSLTPAGTGQGFLRLHVELTH